MNLSLLFAHWLYIPLREILHSYPNVSSTVKPVNIICALVGINLKAERLKYHSLRPAGTPLIKPSSFLGTTFACQYQEAHIRDMTVKAIMDDNVERVAFRYLQSRRGFINTLLECVFYLPVTVASAAMSIYARDYGSVPFLFIGSFSFANVNINFNNSINYFRTSRRALGYLKRNLAPCTISRISSMTYNKKALKRLTDIFKESELPTTPQKHRPNASR